MPAIRVRPREAAATGYGPGAVWRRRQFRSVLTGAVPHVGANVGAKLGLDEKGLMDMDP